MTTDNIPNNINVDIEADDDKDKINFDVVKTYDRLMQMILQ